ncbi:MAG: hypothetical protein KIY11_09855, partial [Thermoplasmata archaeon]|nr:hypothetical protein [Candidatus Sysuiplasma acidicola]
LTYQAVRTWKESDDPAFGRKKRRIDRLTRWRHNPPVVISFDEAGPVLHPTRSVHIRCVDSEWRTRGRVRVSEHSERAFEPGGMQRIKQSKGNHRTVAA